jgi:FlaA1/EpsC-like NDP-sugar epimerase
MTIPEAVQLVLQAGGLGENGNVYVLDMGEPVRIIDLARDLILLSGLEPDVDIPIEVTGLRPGEKLYEELLTAEEGTVASRYQKIFVARNNGLADGDVHTLVGQLLGAAAARNEPEIRRLLRYMIPSYVGETNGVAVAPPVRTDASQGDGADAEAELPTLVTRNPENGARSAGVRRPF